MTLQVELQDTFLGDEDQQSLQSTKQTLYPVQHKRKTEKVQGKHFQNLEI